ncbi:hypothetical protein EDB86DRAFT_3079304 [Lactarius hatsudake]|nr:hypothetical protein EDB86DRAFT_3079304 [Lactarius hatsudake]
MPPDDLPRDQCPLYLSSHRPSSRRSQTFSFNLSNFPLSLHYPLPSPIVSHRSTLLLLVARKTPLVAARVIAPSSKLGGGRPIVFSPLLVHFASLHPVSPRPTFARSRVIPSRLVNSCNPSTGSSPLRTHTDVAPYTATPTYPPEVTVALTPPPPLSPPAILAAHIPVPPFPAGMDHTFTPVPQTRIVEPDPALALLDDEEDKENSDPGIPFFLNDPTAPTFFPLQVRETGTTKQTARYIYYRHNYQEVIGTMGRGHPCYASQVFLNEVYTGQLAQHITDNQLNMFHPHDPRTIVLNEVLVELRNPRLHAEVSRLRECLVRHDAIRVRQSDIRRLETELT